MLAPSSIRDRFWYLLSFGAGVPAVFLPFGQQPFAIPIWLRLALLTIALTAGVIEWWCVLVKGPDAAYLRSEYPDIWRSMFPLGTAAFAFTGGVFRLFNHPSRSQDARLNAIAARAQRWYWGTGLVVFAAVYARLLLR